VDDVVAVDGEVAAEVAEAEEQLDRLVEAEADDVLARALRRARSRRGAIDAQDLEFLQVDVDRMLPAAGIVHEPPSLGRVALHPEADLVAVREAAVHGPLAVLTLEAERARDARRLRGVGQIAEMRAGVGVHTAVGHGVPDTELQELVPLARRAQLVL